MTSFKKYIAAACLGSLCFLGSTQAQAAGFYIQEQSVKGLGTAFAGSVTSIEDASTIYFNPAGMTKLSGPQVNAGVHLLIPDSELDDTGSTVPGGLPIGGDGGNPYSPSPVPNLYAAVPLTENVWGGLGLSAPFGLANEYDDGWFGRYDSTDTDLKTLNFTAALAAEATEWLSVGIGLDIQYARAVLKSAAFAGTEGESRLAGNDISVGYNVGVQADLNEKTEVGIHYRSAISHNLEGRISAEGTTGLDFDAPGGAALNLPDIATFGMAYDVTDRTRVMGQATWFGWNNFQDITAVAANGTVLQQITQNYKTTWAFAIGAEHDLNEKWTVRAGYQFDETPTRAEFRTSRTPDGDRHWISGGATYKYNEKIDLDFAATYIDVADETINVARNQPLTSNVQADTDGYIGILAIGLNYKF